MIVCGGTYLENCVDPDWHQLFGSGGRAASVLGGVAQNVVLITYAADLVRSAIVDLGSTYGFTSRFHGASFPISFDYFHGLSVPAITPAVGEIRSEQSFDVEDTVVLRFGMLEGNARVNATTAVYDPQSAFDPRPFAENGSSAKRLALVLNGSEAIRMSGAENVEVAAKSLLTRESAEVVVVKLGGRGAIVATPQASRVVPAYRSSYVWPVGSGDVFAAAFTYFWAMCDRDPENAADLASRATSMYCEDRALPGLDDPTLQLRTAVRVSSGRVYLAAPFFSLEQRWLVEEARTALKSQGVEVFSPLHDVGWGTAGEVAPADLAGLKGCDRVFAVLDGEDLGTVFEVGFARAIGLPVVAFTQRLPVETLKMIEGSGCKIVNDFVTAIYETAWI